MTFFRIVKESLSFVAAVLAIVGVASANIVDSPGLRITLVAGAIFFLVLMAFVHARQVRKARYADAMEHIATAYDLCIDAVQRGISNEKRVQDTSGGVCKELAKAFSIITGSRCEVCVKRLRGRAGNLVAATFCRSGRPGDRPVEPREHHHLITENTDFREIFVETQETPLVRIFRANALPFRKNYENTSFAMYGGAPKAVPIALVRQFVNYITWKLPYRSTMVAPILASPMADPKRDELVGYLCVDSKRMFVFRKRDELLLTGMAAALHPMIYTVVAASARVTRPGGKP